jgi:hypothetical protein
MSSARASVFVRLFDVAMFVLLAVTGIWAILSQSYRIAATASFARGGLKARRKFSLPFQCDQIVTLAPIEVVGRSLLTLRINRSCRDIEVLGPDQTVICNPGSVVYNGKFVDYDFTNDGIKPWVTSVRFRLVYQTPTVMHSFRLARSRPGAMDTAKVVLEIRGRARVAQMPQSPISEALTGGFPVVLSQPDAAGQAAASDQNVATPPSTMVYFDPE